MRQTLFRTEAIEHNRPTLAGEVLAVHRLSLRVVALACLMLTGVVVTFAYMGEYTPKVRVHGVLEATPQIETSTAIRARSTGPLQAKLWIPNHSLGLIGRGSRVALRSSDLPFQREGSFSGTVIGVDSAPISATSPLSLITVELASERVTASGAAMPLHAGMKIEADIKLKPRRLINWIINPVLGEAP